ncbi:MAG: DsbA family protein [Myxococcota bacterium]
MNKGTAIVGFIMSFIAGVFLMWGIDRGRGPDIQAESAASGGAVADQSAASVPVTAKDPQKGKADAPVTIVEISDFQCPFCSRVGPTIKQIEDTYKDQVRVVFKHNPLPFHNRARPAAEASNTVFALGGSAAFWKFHDQAFANQQNLTDENFENWAAAAGVDKAKFKEAYSAKKHAAKVDEDMALAQKIGANGTPAFRINGVSVSGAQPFEKFKEVIDQQLAEAKKLIGSGTRPSDVYVQLTNKNQAAQPEAPKPADKPAKGEEEDDKTVWRVPVAADDPIKGPKDALVTLIVFSEFQCPFCKRVEDTLKQVSDTYGNDVRIVWKDNPLPFHNRAKPTAIFARYVYTKKGDKGFWDAHDALFASQPKLEDDDLKTIAEKVGIDWAGAKAAMDANKFADRLDQSVELANDFQARGTPHFFINGVRLSGAQPFDKFKSMIDEQLAKAKGLIAKGTPRGKIYEEVTKDGKEPPPPEKKEVPAADASDPSKGGAGAKVTIQIFSDYQCPFCKRVEDTLKSLEQTYGNKVKWVWKDMPLPFHKDAPLAAEAALEAFAQKGNAGFWKFHDKLFEVQPEIQRPALEKIAQEIGLDMDKFKAALDSNKHKAKVEASTKVGNNAGINGTPAFVINGYFLSGAQPEAAFKKLINRALKEAGG